MSFCCPYLHPLLRPSNSRPNNTSNDLLANLRAKPPNTPIQNLRQAKRVKRGVVSISLETAQDIATTSRTKDAALRERSHLPHIHLPLLHLPHNPLGEPQQRVVLIQSEDPPRVRHQAPDGFLGVPSLQDPVDAPELNTEGADLLPGPKEVADGPSLWGGRSLLNECSKSESRSGELSSHVGVRQCAGQKLYFVIPELAKRLFL